VNVAGFDIPGGMVYVGSFLTASPGGGWAADTPAPCLINPRLKVDRGRPNPSLDMGYWPSYTDIEPAHRLNYLHWLASGKRDTSYQVGYAFLYFYGLERRLIADNPPKEERDLLVAEVLRLNDLYQANGSFRGYSRGLLNLLELRDTLAVPNSLAGWTPDLDKLDRSMPLAMKLKLALHASQGIPLEFDDAMAAVLTLPSGAGGLRRSGAVARARQELIALARQRFPQRFPEGFKLKDRKSSSLHLGYNAASRNLEVEVTVDGGKRLPDPMNLTWTKMTEFCESVVQDLAPFAKAIGKDRERANSLEAILALPPELGDASAAQPIRDWLNNLPKPIAHVSVSELGQRCFGEVRDLTGAKQTRDLSAILGRLGYGMEPDPTLLGGKLANSVMIFPATDATGATQPLSAGFHVAALVVGVLGEATSEEGIRRVSELARQLRLSLPEAARLAARQRLYTGKPLTAARLKAAAAKLPAAEQSIVASLAARVAAGGGDVDKATMASLERLYDAFGLERRDLYSQLHHGAASAAPRATEPVQVEQAAPQGQRYRIPPPPVATKPTGPVIEIDMSKVGAIMRETSEVERILAPIYEEEVEKTAPTPSTPESSAAGALGRFAGLRAPTDKLLEILVTRSEWSRAEFEAKANGLGIMPNGVLEAINEWAIDTFDEELIEDGDPLTINVALLAGAPGEAA
jgi:hypothetical protein